MASKTQNAFAGKKMLGRAVKDSFMKLNPKTQVRNPVMLLVYLSAFLTTGLWIISLFGLRDASSGYTLSIAIILWFTVLFANFAEAIAEGRGKAQADSLRAARKDVEAHRIPSLNEKGKAAAVSSAILKKGDYVIVRAGEQIPGDGEVMEGGGVGGRKRHYRRIRPGDPGSGGRQKRRHRRHHRAFRLDCCADHK